MRKKKSNTPGMKLCKYCQTEIPKAAKICPNCKKKQSRKGLIALLVIVIIIVLFIIIAATGGSRGAESETTISSDSTSVSSSTGETQVEDEMSSSEELTDETEEAVVDEPEITEEEYKDACEEIGYKDLARTPDDYTGSMVTVTGEIMQVQESGSEAIYLMNITENEYGFWEDLVWINAPLDQNNRYLEDDIVQIWGEYQGIRTYSTVLSAENSVPEINAEYLELIE